MVSFLLYRDIEAYRQTDIEIDKQIQEQRIGTDKQREGKTLRCATFGKYVKTEYNYKYYATD